MSYTRSMSRSRRLSLTARQREALTFIRQCVRRRGYGPTVREIGDSMGIISPNGVIGHLDALEKKGFILRRANLSRSIQLLTGHERHPDGLRVTFFVQDGLLVKNTKPEWMSLDDTLTSGDSSFCLIRVSDDSLTAQAFRDSRFDHVFRKGDQLVLRCSRSAAVGETVLLHTADDTFLLAECAEDTAAEHTFLVPLVVSREKEIYKNSAADVHGVLIAIIRMI